MLSRFCIVKWKRGFRCSIWWSTRWGSQLSSSRSGRSLKNPAKFPPNFPRNFPPKNQKVRNPEMWERANVGFGGTGRKRKGPCTKQCAVRKHGLSDTRLAEACPPKLRNTVKYRVEEMRPKWAFWQHRVPKMRLVEAQCAHRKHCYPEIPLGGHPTSRVSQKRITDELLQERRENDFRNLACM